MKKRISNAFKKVLGIRLFNSTLVVVMAVVVVSILVTKYKIVMNHDASLPINGVIIKVGAIPQKRDQVFVFNVRNNPHFKSNEIKFIKLVGGLSGDEIEARGGEIFLGKKMLPHFQDDVLTHDDFFYTINLAKLSDPEGFKKKDITIIDKEIQVAGRLIMVAKPYTRKVEELIKMKSDFDAKEFRLHAIESGKIPAHKFFAYTPHKDSFDSRYQEIGLIDEKDIIGTAILTF